jgi:hypothetical protein
MPSAAAGRPERQRLRDVAGFDLATRQYRDDGVGDGGEEALGHWWRLGWAGLDK